MLMRVCCLFFLGLFLGTSFVHAGEDMSLAGAGVVTAQSPYRGVGMNSFAVPVLSGEHKNVYVRGVETGYHFYRNDAVTLSVLAVPRFMGYHSSDSGDLAGMEDRERSFDAGVRAEWVLPYGEDCFLTARLVTDAASRHDGQEADLALSRKFKGKIYRLTPAVGVRFQSRQMVEYYYGVRSTEARAGRSAYDPGSAVNAYGNVMFSFGISPRWIVVTRAGVEFLGGSIQKSPIVGRHYLMNGVIGLTRKF